MRLIILILFISFSGLFSAEEEEISISFNPIFENQTIHLEEVLYYNSGKDSLVIESIRFYISNIVFLQDNEITHTVSDGYYLIDMEHPESLKITLPLSNITKYNSIQFGIGIDSATNSKGVFGGALDPINGMYWTWQSGYINFKLEGISDKCSTRKNRFQYHLGGYQYPLNLYRETELKIPSNNSSIIIDVDISEFIKMLDLETTNQIMSPSNDALKIANSLPKIFKISN